jgi:hypothetical protein
MSELRKASAVARHKASDNYSVSPLDGLRSQKIKI